MFSSGRQSSSWVSMFCMLLVGLLPPGLGSACRCGPRGCCVAAEASREASVPTKRSCCSNAARASQAATASCCRPQHSMSGNCCCGNQFSANVDSVRDCVDSAGGRATDSGCCCSPAPVKTSALPATESVPLDRAIDCALLPVMAIRAIAPPLALSPADFSASLIHAPPVPVRELFCVWRT